MTWRAWSSDADGGVRTSILTAQTTPAPDLTRRVTPQNPRSQRYHHDFAEALPRHRPDPRLQRQKPPRRRMNELTMSRGLDSAPPKRRTHRDRHLADASRVAATPPTSG